MRLARDKKRRQLALSFTDDALVRLVEVIVAAGGPTVAPETLVPDLVAHTNKKRTRVKLRGTVDLGAAGTFGVRLRGKLTDAS